ncbi:unnamed protein product [Hyaloperonospora brassicae]|uniref:RNase III domain-containing protein n=1 Tax=Hyaloperonospora brassicae TaxID=162125 RepID=A0AAV0T8T6_HYABA|nr:unnamed protein product [Hyaloperonospora brassicae]
MTKKRRQSHPRACRALSAINESFCTKRARARRDHSTCSTPHQSGASPETVAHFRALQRSTASVAIADVFEWLGDALLGELIGRCLLSQFHHAPVSVRVFRNVRLAVVTNRNLARVYDAMGYATVRCHHPMGAALKAVTMKDRADVVEAVVGELVVTAYRQKTSDVDGYRAHLDAVVATMLHTHFDALLHKRNEFGETAMTAKGPLSVAFNPFACLPREHLDDTTGALVVTDGVFFDSEEATDGFCLSDACSRNGQMETREEATVVPHHYFAHVSETAAAVAAAVEERDGVTTTSGVHCIELAMAELHDAHLLRTSREFFEVFKIYGMAVLSERLSLSLALPHVSSGSLKGPDMVTPARLTRQRQLVLSMANLAACATLLGIAAPAAHDDDEDNEESAARRLQKEHGYANTLRAFVGYHSAVATTSASAKSRSNVLVNTVCTALHAAVVSSESEISTAPLRSSEIPEREPLMAMKRSVDQVRMFMRSKTCDDLHARDERPKSEAAVERERTERSSAILRHCDSIELADLFETLSREQDAQQKQRKPARTRRKKKKKLIEEFAFTAGSITPALERFLHRRFLFCLEDIVILFAQRKTEACRAQIAAYRHDLEPCANHFRKWEVSTSTLTLAMRDSSFRLLLHEMCHFHAIVSSSRNTRDGARITQLRLPLHYTWANINTRVTSEQQACS